MPGSSTDPFPRYQTAEPGRRRLPWRSLRLAVMLLVLVALVVVVVLVAGHDPSPFQHG